MSTSTIKLNNSTEVIPISVVPQGSSGRKNDRYKHAYRPDHGQNMAQNIQKQRPQLYPYFGDPLIVPRVKQYLEDHSHDVRIDFEDMVDTLQAKYREYGKRKRNAFKGLVDRAYSSVLHEFSLKVGGSGIVDPEVYSSDSSDPGGLNDDDIPQSGNKMNMHLMSMYASGNAKKSMQKRNPGQEELINISSSEDEEGGNSKKRYHASNRSSAIPDKASITAIPLKHLGNATSTPAANGANITVTALPSQLTVELNTPVTERSRKRKVADLFRSNKITASSSKKKREVPALEPEVTFNDFGGNSKVLEEVCQLLVHIRHPEVYRQIGVSPPRGFLLHGPPGCGKTLLAQAIAGELEVPLIKVASPELVAGVSGESEERIRDLFDQALAAAPCVLFLDEVDAITPNRHTAQREMERRIVAQLLTCLDDLGQKENGDLVLVIGATNRPDALDPALRRAGRFDREVCLGIPDLNSRIQILKVVCCQLRLSPDVSFEEIARNTPGFVGADLKALTREAAMAAVNRVFVNLKKNIKESRQVSSRVAAKVTEEKKDVEITVEDDKSQGASESVSQKEVEVMEEDDKVNKDAEPTGDKAEESAVKSDANDKDTTVLEEKQPEESVKEPKSTELKVTDDEVIIEETNMEVCEDLPSSSDENIVTIEEPVLRRFAPALEEMISWLHDTVPLSPRQLEDLHVEKSDFDQALKCVQPSAKREGFATVPDVTWDDVGSLQDIRDELQMAILAPVRHPAQFAALGLTTPMGILLCGPPGCGKTLLAKAVANEAGVNFISVKGPELLNMYVGESERAVRQCFQRARNSAPCVIFFDELDSLCPKRSDSGEGGASMRVVNQMLTEMDGVEGRKGVYLMAATNRPDIVDPAVLRPGRLDKILYVGLPTGPDRVAILKALTKNGTKPPLDPDVCLKRLGECPQCNGYSGADLAALVREAGIVALKEFLAKDKGEQQLVVAETHFHQALGKIRPSVSEKDRKYYEKLREVYTAVPQH